MAIGYVGNIKVETHANEMVVSLLGDSREPKESIHLPYADFADLILAFQTVTETDRHLQEWLSISKTRLTTKIISVGAPKND